MENLNSVDVVYTNDKSKWTRCVIVEAQENPDLAEGGALKMGLRESPSVDKNGQMMVVEEMVWDGFLDMQLMLKQERG